jgi:hypothetical protein
MAKAAQMLGQKATLSGFASPLPAFESYEPATNRF